MKIAVIGAGIGGLSLSAAMARAGMQCAVFEQSRELTEVGAGIQLAPNAVRLLQRLGLRTALRDSAVRPDAMEIRRWDDDQLLSRTVLGADCEQLYGAPYYTIHRAHLQQALLDLPGNRSVRLGHKLVRVQQRADNVALLFDNGVTYEADLVIGADGIHSVVRNELLQDAPIFSGHSIYRGLVPANLLPAELLQPRVNVWIGPGQHCVCYPVSGGGSISFAATTPSEDRSGEAWSIAGDPAVLARAYSGWNRAVSALIQAAGSVGRWALHDRDPLRSWSAGRIAVLGDAAHAMLPFMAQGANQAIEDALALATCLAGVSVSEVDAALARYEALRMLRTADIQGGSRNNDRMLHLADGAEQRKRDVSFSAGPGLQGLAWLYGHDAEAAARTLPGGALSLA